MNRDKSKYKFSFSDKGKLRPEGFVVFEIEDVKYNMHPQISEEKIYRQSIEKYIPEKYRDQVHIQAKLILQQGVEYLINFLAEHYDIVQFQPDKLHVQESECMFKIDNLETITLEIKPHQIE